MDEAALRVKLGAAIRERRMALAVSQEGFADAIQMHRTYYSSIERGERNLTLVTLWRVAEGLEVKVSQLLRDAGL
ncbi:helix-turn-helix domain-containing protein [Lysobacter gummosus]|uniref:Helix-turn-helix transcriptional regulator n=1 Tax=Lysobacter gummosus TaxID=262324 RepID=A0ABY3XGF2_9GAMM|nr:helix-turn-helix transcriptional regulator [Lysobacter gummosus]UNP30720.1 helix-turn-helix transcriptional regulator [Lysobacter gummosus]